MDNNKGVQQVQRKSTEEDYWNVGSSFALPYNNPELRFNPKTDNRDYIDTKDPEFEQLFKEADGATKKEMLTANNNSDAIKIAKRRLVYEGSEKAIAQDSVLHQLGHGLLPSLVNVSTLAPLGVVYKAAEIAKGASMLIRASSGAAAGAVGGTVANTIDEGVFDLQGEQTHYLSAAATGAVLGGGLGAIGGLLVGSTKHSDARSITKEEDTYEEDFYKDPNLHTTIEDGVVRIIEPEYSDVAPMKKSIIDRVPVVGKVLRSDVHTVMQSKSAGLRAIMLKLSKPTVSVRDSKGNVIRVAETVEDRKYKLQGHANTLNQSLEETYHSAKKEGKYKGSMEDYNKDIWKVYSEGMIEQRNVVYPKVEERFKPIATKLQEERAAKRKEVMSKEVPHYHFEDGYRPIRQEDIDSGIIDESKVVLAPIENKEKKKLLEQIDEEYKATLKAEKNRLFDEEFTNYKGEFKGDEHLVKGAEAYRKYYQNMLEEAKRAGIKELKDISVHRLYSPRTYNFRKIRSMSKEEVIPILKRGVANDVRNKAMTEEELQAAAEAAYEVINKAVFDTKFLSTSFLAKDLPFNTRLKQEKLYLSERDMPEILVNDMNDIVGAYNYGMKGRIALVEKLGTDNMQELHDLMYDVVGSEATKKEIEAFDRVIQDLSGVLRMNQLADTPAWNFTRPLLSYNSLRLGGGFGGAQVIELAGVMAMKGVKAIFRAGFLRSLKDTTHILFTKSGKQSNFAEFLLTSGHLGEALHTSRINRYGDTEQGFNSGWLENKLAGMNDSLMKFNGMRYFMGVMEDFTGGAIITDIKHGSISKDKIKDLGLSPSMYNTLKDKLKGVKLDDTFSLEHLSNGERDALQLAISRGMREVIVEGDSIHLPYWMKVASPLTKLLTQFMRFPLIAQEVLLRRGLSDAKAEMASGVFASVAMYLSIKYLREQAAISIGALDPSDSKYDFSDYNDDDWKRAIGEAMGYVAPLGFLTSLTNYGYSMTGHSELGRDWVSKDKLATIGGVTGGLIKDVSTILENTSKGHATDVRTLKKIQHLLPAYNLPIIKEAGDNLVEELGD